MGLNRLSPDLWLQDCPRLPHYHHNKLCARRRLGDRVYAQLPSSLPAQRELVALLAQHLRQHHPMYHFQSGGDLAWQHSAGCLRWPGPAAAIVSGEPLWNASLWVADDLCILMPGERGYTLVAASLAAPSYWRLEEKIGQPLAEIHRPVPGFAENIGAQVSRFFDHLLPEFPVWRGNWSVVDSAELLHRGESSETGSSETGSSEADSSEADSSETDSSEAGSSEADSSEVDSSEADNDNTERGLFLRVERQSLRRLPQTGAVVFSIRVMINPLEDLLGMAGVLRQLQAAVASMSPQESRYKSIAPFRHQLEAFFAAHLAPS
ncbi:DUF3445 domain-containing protein [Microbulbifer sp. Q7]|uniref:heme-dependent oxidative N-demethylase family protein n=1 Tax=Microbulbifer sp. Q7 TaxID=1785091 RepID=UPI0009ED9277|nr:DUF3445 domain-containing protein [Microbulbifer sp. Q7]